MATTVPITRSPVGTALRCVATRDTTSYTTSSNPAHMQTHSSTRRTTVTYSPSASLDYSEALLAGRDSLELRAMILCDPTQLLPGASS